jgi:23S rRNA (adenine2503-C2)-methyltransferase
MDGKPTLIGMSREEMVAAMADAGVPEKQRKMRVNQIWHWLYVRGSSDFADMHTISRELRETLAARYTVARPEIVEEQISNDGTRKWLMRFPPRGAGRPVEVETVYIPEEGRGTLCISSQVGCTLTCTFCHTGTQKLVRNLTAEEILSQQFWSPAIGSAISRTRTRRRARSCLPRAARSPTSS